MAQISLVVYGNGLLHGEENQVSASLALAAESLRELAELAARLEEKGWQIEAREEERCQLLEASLFLPVFTEREHAQLLLLLGRSAPFSLLRVDGEPIFLELESSPPLSAGEFAQTEPLVLRASYSLRERALAREDSQWLAAHGWRLDNACQEIIARKLGSFQQEVTPALPHLRLTHYQAYAGGEQISWPLS